jgi:plasmid replication initiation protein
VSRAPGRTIVLDRSLEALPLFRLSDSSEDAALTYEPRAGARWRVLPAPGDRLPGTFDQDVYVELLDRYGEAGNPQDGVVTFTLHGFLRRMDRRVDGRTYEQLRAALVRLERTVLESSRAYFVADGITPGEGSHPDTRFTILTSVVIDRRRSSDRDQLALFDSLTTAEPGDARVTLSPILRANVLAGHTITLSSGQYAALQSPTARRLYRILEVARAEGHVAWRVALDALAEQLPLSQRYPSHLHRVLQPAHDLLVQVGIVRDAEIRQHQRDWFVDYVLASRG